MSRFQRLLASSIGAKVGMAVTGILLSFFVVGHLMGNLLVYQGRQAVNDYAAFLKGLGPWLWVVRAGLLGVFVLHIVLAIQLKRRNQAARTVGYAKDHVTVATFASRYMVLTGLCIAAFVLLHLAHFTLGWIDPTSHAVTEKVIQGGVEIERHDVYAMVVAGFRQPVYVAIYVAAMVLLGLHLFHGLQSLFQTLGVRHPGYTPTIVRACRLAAIALSAGYISIPVGVLLGLTGAEGAS
ncbi:MAG: succinate dehydrogenase cytochrome b subunit [Planctomycetota bacterium]